MLTWTRHDWLNLGLFALLITLFYWRILTPNEADRQSFPPGDFSFQFWAFSTYEVRELSAGRLPLWNPYTYSGAPFWADVQAAVFYPPSLLTLLLSAPWGFSLFALEIEALVHFWLAACFMYLFMRELTQHRPAATLSALSFTFSGYLTGYPSQQLAVLESVIWLPLMLYFITKARQPSAIPFHYSLASVAWAMCLLAGHPQSAFIVACMSLAYVVMKNEELRIKHAERPTSYVSLLTTHLKLLITHYALFMLLGTALAAIQFIPAVEYTLLSVRASGVYDNMAGGFPFIDLVQVLLPHLVSHYSPLYVGVMGLIMALAMAFTPHPAQRQTTFWAALAVITLFISFGGNTFLYSALYLGAPGFSMFRGQERWAFATTFSLCVLLGYGYQAVNHPPIKEKLLNITQYLWSMALLLAGVSFYGLNDTGWKPDNPFYGLLEATTLLLLLLSLTWLWGRFQGELSPHMGAIWAVLLICFDLFTVNWQTNLYPQRPEWHTQKPALVEAIQRDQANQADPFRVYNEFRLYDNYGVPFALQDLWGASPLRLARYVEFLAPPMPIERAWELLNVKYVITWRKELYVPSTIIYEEPTADGATYVHRLNTVGPRAWVVAQTQVVDDKTILQKIADPTFDRWQIGLFEDESITRPYRFSKPVRSEISQIEFPTPQSMVIKVTSDQPAWLILSEPYYPGWQATVNGQPVPIVRADYILRAVPLPAGDMVVEFTFRPMSFMLGALISLVAWLGVIVYGVRDKWRKNSTF